MGEEQADISNKTIVVLVLLTVLISVLSTLVVLNEVMGLKTDSAGTSARSQTSTGKVTLEISPAPATTTGQVVLEIKRPVKN